MSNHISYILIALAFMSCTSFREKQAMKKMQQDEAYHNSIKCVLGNKYSLEQRKIMFPFNKAKKIVAISYKNYEMFSETEGIDTLIDSNGKPFPVPKKISACDNKNVIERWKIKGSNDFIAYYCAIEKVEFNTSQIDTLSNILLNFELDKQPYQLFKPGCYTPRNSILFFDEKEEIIAVVEVCFECMQIKFSYEKEGENLIDCNCNERRESLKSLFVNSGIKYGIEVKY
jgi:hypothetical protein